MPYDVVAANRQAVQSGLALGAQMFNNNLRMQELQSQQALQRLKERQAAQQLSYQIEAHDLEVQRRADTEKAMARVMADTMPTLNVPTFGPPMVGADGLPDTAIPNPNALPLEDALGKHLLPVIAKYDRTGSEAFNALADIAKMKRERQQSLFKPSLGTLTDESGQEVKYFQGGPNQAYPIGTGNVKTTETPSGDEFYFDERNRPHRIPRDSEGRMLRVADVKKLKDAPGGAALLEWDDTKGAFVLPPKNAEAAQKVLAAAGSISPTTRKDLEAAEISATALIREGRKLLPLINENTVGAKGEIKRLLSRSGVSLVFPSLDDPQVAEADAVGRGFTAKVIRSLRSDGNIGVAEVKALEQASNTISWTNVKPAKARLATFLEKANEIGRDAYTRMGKPIPDQYLTLKELAARSDLSIQQAAEIYSDTYDNLIHQVRIEAGLK